jgi:hypothetical protein
MKNQTKKFKVEQGCKFVDKSTGIAYIVRDVSPKTILYRSIDGQGELSSCACSTQLFETKLQNRVFEIVQ